MENKEQNSSDNYIVIPNPIYDVVLKYLMEDNQSAKIILSTLINENIKELAFEAIPHTEKVQNSENEKTAELFLFDFSAIVKKADGEEELIMIELQKANTASDIIRLKEAIRRNFQRKETYGLIDPHTKKRRKVYSPLRLIQIFILDFCTENEINDLVIKTRRQDIGLFGEKNLVKERELLDILSFDTWVVQLPNLGNIAKADYENDDYKTKLYQLLKLFDQDVKNDNDKHKLLINENYFPKFMEGIINRLKLADFDNLDFEKQMNAEDEYFEELKKRDFLYSLL